MSAGTLVLLAGILSGAVTLLMMLWAGRPSAWRLRGPSAINHRGQRVPVVLGLATGAGLFVGVLAVVGVDAGQRRLIPSARETLQILAAVLLVFAGGLLDDLYPYGLHGLVRHLSQLARGRVTSGIIKMGTAVLAAAAVALATHQHGLRLALGIPFVAGAANLWNLLDVVPGRALKWFLPAAVAVLALAPTNGFGLFASAALGGAVIALLFDLAETAMLGDSGAYVLGFVAGAGLLVRLPTVGVMIGLALVVAFHVLAETVTLTRMIRATTPLRWVDDLGRLPDEDLRPESSTSA
jgi:UDP-GlcNAc:undecaprenyl-phosphate GlcNAc-1-phosphate transferase